MSRRKVHVWKRWIDGGPRYETQCFRVFNRFEVESNGLLGNATCLHCLQRVAWWSSGRAAREADRAHEAVARAASVRAAETRRKRRRRASA